MNEKVKEILRTNYITGNADDFELSCETEEEFTNRVAQQICQLFPKSPDNPDGYEPRADIDRGMGKIISKKPKPDEGRLLTDKDNPFSAESGSDEAGRHFDWQAGYNTGCAKTASIKDAEIAELEKGMEELVAISQKRYKDGKADAGKECQERVERVIKTGDAILEIARHGDYSSGNEFYGQDEGRIKAGILLDEVAAEWQALKEGVK